MTTYVSLTFPQRSSSFNWHQSSACSIVCRDLKLVTLSPYPRMLLSGYTWHTSSQTLLRSLLPRNEASAFLCRQLGPSGDAFWLAHVSSQMPPDTYPPLTLPSRNHTIHTNQVPVCPLTRIVCHSLPPNTILHTGNRTERAAIRAGAGEAPFSVHAGSGQCLV